MGIYNLLVYLSLIYVSNIHLPKDLKTVYYFFFHHLLGCPWKLVTLSKLVYNLITELTTYLYIGGIIHLLSTMDIPVDSLGYRGNPLIFQYIPVIPCFLEVFLEPTGLENQGM